MIKDPELPYIPEHEALTKLVLEVVRQLALRDIRDGRPGPGNQITLDELFQFVKNGVVWIRFREGNPPFPELVIVPPTYQ